MDLSVVSTLYYSASYLDEFHRRVSASAQAITGDYEIIFINDGSPDNSLETALRIQVHDPGHVRIIDLSRNFGHHKAIMTGLAHARGDLVFLIDCDLEEMPELLEQFCRVYESDHVDVVFGVQNTRSGSWYRRISGQLFYTIFNTISETKLPANLVTVRLMSHRYVEALLTCQEHEMIIAGLWAFVGFEQRAIAINKPHKGSSAYNLKRQLQLLLRSITAFSARPLVFIAVLGTIITILSLLAALYFIAIYLFLGHPPGGYTSLIVSIWFLGGLTIFCLGVIAVYLSVVFKEVKRRPYTIVRHVYELE